MNHLAHMLLSCQDEDLLLGNFMADFLTNKDQKSFGPAIQKGIELHKSIDAFTDQHTDVKRSIDILRPSQGKYTPVVIDIIYDYFLIKHWDRFSSVPFNDFKEKMYVLLEKNIEIYPEKLQILLQKMIQDDFLTSCSNKERLNQTFVRLSGRAKFPNNFSNIIPDLETNSTALERHFLSFFPELIAHVQPFCNCN